MSHIVVRSVVLPGHFGWRARKPVSVDAMNKAKAMDLLKGGNQNDCEVGDGMEDEKSNDKRVIGEVRSVAGSDSGLFLSTLWKLTMLYDSK